jgi:hypothetical protein
MEEAKLSCEKGEWRSAGKLYKNVAASGHNLYIQTSAGANPAFLTPLLPVAFELSAGKDKVIEADSILNMELSVREHNTDCIAFGDVIDRFTLETVSGRIKELYSGMDPAFLRMLQRRVMAPKKEHKFAPQPPYAWRFKLGKTATYLVVIGTDDNGTDQCRAGTAADIKPGYMVRVNAVFTKIYTSPTSFGPNFDVDVVLIYPGGTGGRNKASAADNYGFGDCVINVVKDVPPTEEGGGADADAAVGADAGSGAGGGGGGAYDDGADQPSDSTDAKQHNEDAIGRGAAPADADSEPDNKRGRSFDPYE